MFNVDRIPGKDEFVEKNKKPASFGMQVLLSESCQIMSHH